MQKYLELISGFLQKEESCFLPGIGVLKYERQSAVEKNGFILPPTSHIVLDQSANQAQHHILHEIEYHFHLSEVETKSEWDKTFDELKKQKKPIIIPPIGELIQVDDGSFIWNSYSLESFYKPVPFQENVPASEQEPYEEKKNHFKKTLYILLPLILLALFVLGYFGYQYLFNPPAKTLKEDSTITPVESTGPPFASTPTTDTVNARKAPQQKTKTTDSLHFVVIYIVYHNKYNAEKHYKKMRNWGHNVSIYTPDSGIFMVGYPFYEMPKDTTKRLEEIQDIYGGNPFIIYPEK